MCLEGHEFGNPSLQTISMISTSFEFDFDRDQQTIAVSNRDNSHEKKDYGPMCSWRGT